MAATGDSPARAAYKMLRTQVLQRMREHAMQTLAVVSPGCGEGKSLTAANLAISIAEDSNRSALLVDLDLRRPAVASLFGLEPQRGLDDYLRGECRLEEVFVRTEPYERLALLPVRAPSGRSSELLTGKPMREFVAEVRGRYADRTVLFDLPPVLASDDVLAFSPLVDAALVVAAEGRTRRDDLVRTLELLRSTRIVGTVLNGSMDASAQAY
jgi:Mrp family chromosome partitioning ATPase